SLMRSNGGACSGNGLGSANGFADGAAGAAFGDIDTAATISAAAAPRQSKGKRSIEIPLGMNRGQLRPKRARRDCSRAIPHEPAIWTDRSVQILVNDRPAMVLDRGRPARAG